ncbi:MAG: HigA family addiction module antitoxin [Candidatus Cloacimonetes bacterium]|nr:HigA family addiction module antitoxin [Candidatus Cloacimonadota bacterium]
MSKSKRYEFKPNYAVLPGDSLREAIEYLGMSQVEFAQRMGITEQTLVRILNGEQKISYETASSLELVTGTASEFWINLEAQYQKQLQIEEQQKSKEALAAWLKQIPIASLCKLGYIKIHEDVVLQARELLSFFRTSSVETFDKDVERIMAAARSSAAYGTSAVLAATYIYMGKKDAEGLQVAPYNKARFRAVLKEVKNMTQNPPKDFDIKLQELFASAGVALVYVPLIKGVHFNAVCKWLSPDRAMIVASNKGKAEDIFWFSLFHEAAHILLHSKKQIFISDSSPENPKEKEADEFAANFLIPSRHNRRIIAVSSEEELKELAKEFGVSVGIVAGRYHYLTQKWNKYRHLIRKIDWE